MLENDSGSIGVMPLKFEHYVLDLGAINQVKENHPTTKSML